MSCLVCTNLFYYNFVVLPILMGAGIYQNEEPIVLGDYDMLYEPIMMGICIIFEKSLMRLLIVYFEIKERFSKKKKKKKKHWKHWKYSLLAHLTAKNGPSSADQISITSSQSADQTTTCAHFDDVKCIIVKQMMHVTTHAI